MSSLIHPPLQIWMMNLTKQMVEVLTRTTQMEKIISTSLVWLSRMFGSSWIMRYSFLFIIWFYSIYCTHIRFPEILLAYLMMMKALRWSVLGQETVDDQVQRPLNCQPQNLKVYSMTKRIQVPVMKNLNKRWCIQEPIRRERRWRYVWSLLFIPVVPLLIHSLESE